MTCDSQIDSRGNSRASVRLGSSESEAVLSCVALSQVSDCQSELVLTALILDTICILWLCSQIHRYPSVHFVKPERVFCPHRIRPCTRLVTVSVMHLHRRALQGADMSRGVSRSPAILSLRHWNTEHSRKL